MTDLKLVLQPRGPIIARTASPFTSDPGAQATTLDWPLPQTIANAFRSHLGEERGTNWREDVARKQIAAIRVHGGFLIDQAIGDSAWTPYFPTPLDARITVPKGKTDPEIRSFRPQPFRPGEGANLPLVGETPVQLAVIDQTGKPKYGYDQWSVNDIIAWMIDPDSTRLPERYRGAMTQGSRTHVMIDPTTGTAKDGHLYATTGLAFSPAAINGNPKQAILCRVTLPGGMAAPRIPAFFSLGGEKRQTRLSDAEPLTTDPWAVPEALVDALEHQQSFRLQLVTPAIFRHGWRPGWLTQQHRDRIPPALKGLNCTLVSAVTERPVPVSGWEIRNAREKPLRYAAPAGSVYFIRVKEPLSREQIKGLWLASITDSSYDREDGYGLAVPGVWLKENEDKR
jgi:CRISPR-associated protein Cmr3